MKKFTLYIFLICSLNAFSQRSGDFGITAYSGFDNSNQRTTLGGITFKPYVGGDKIQLNYNLRMGSSEANGFTVQTSLGVLGGGALFIAALGDEDDWYALGILSCFIPEGITYNIFLDDNTAISPFINGLSMEYNRNYVRMFFETGVSFKKYLDNSLYFSCDLGLKSLYRKSKSVVYLGGTIGIALDD